MSHVQIHGFPSGTNRLLLTHSPVYTVRMPSAYQLYWGGPPLIWVLLCHLCQWKTSLTHVSSRLQPWDTGYQTSLSCNVKLILFNSVLHIHFNSIIHLSIIYHRLGDRRALRRGMTLENYIFSGCPKWGKTSFLVPHLTLIQVPNGAQTIFNDHSDNVCHTWARLALSFWCQVMHTKFIDDSVPGRCYSSTYCPSGSSHEERYWLVTKCTSGSKGDEILCTCSKSTMYCLFYTICNCIY